MSNKNKYEIADYMRAFFLKQPLNQEAIEQMNTYIIIRSLAMTLTGPQIANIVNKYSFILRNHKHELYQILYQLVPRQSRQPYVAYAKRKQLKYSDEIYTVLKQLYGDWYNSAELDEIVDFVLKVPYLREELYNTLLKSGLDIKELQANFPELFKDIQKEVSVKKIHKELLKQIKKKNLNVNDLL